MIIGVRTQLFVYNCEIPTACEEGATMQETTEQYRARMFQDLGTQDPLKLQAATPAKLQRLLKGVSTAKLRKRPQPNKWSIAEIVCHLADAELVGGFRMRLIVGAPGTPITPFDQDVWVTALHYDKRDARKALDQFRVLREANLALLKTLTPTQWKQVGMHAERGPESVETIVKMFAGHDVNHLRQIEAILAAKK
jgi:hypothetical protein